MDILSVCPSCSTPLDAVRLSCPTCSLALEGRFRLCPFCQAGPEAREFALTFLSCKGNIKEVERELGISYPTVRGRLEELLKILSGSLRHRAGPAATGSRRPETMWPGAVGPPFSASTAEVRAAYMPYCEAPARSPGVQTRAERLNVLRALRDGKISRQEALHRLAEGDLPTESADVPLPGARPKPQRGAETKHRSQPDA